MEENAQALVCGGEDGTVNVFDVATGNLVQRLQHESGMFQLNVIPLVHPNDDMIRHEYDLLCSGRYFFHLQEMC